MDRRTVALRQPVSGSLGFGVLLVLALNAVVLMFTGVTAGEERTQTQERYASCGSPFGIQDLTEARLGDYTDVVDAGVGWVRLEGLNGLNWAIVEEKSGAYDWARTDTLARDLSEEGLEILWTVSSFHPSSGRIHFLPADMDGYLRFLSAAVERYDGDGMDDAPGSPVVSVFQIENEVDGHFWEDSAAHYAVLLKESIRVIKEANPHAKVAIAGASTPEGYYRFYPEILAEFSAADEGFDVLDVHWYESVGDYAVHPKGNVPLVDFLEDLRTAAPSAEVWFTEVGTHSGCDVDPGKPCQTEVEQASELVKRYVHLVGNGVARVFWHTLLESRSYTKLMGQNDFFDNTGLIYNGYTFRDGEAIYRPAGVGEDRGDGVKKLGFYSYKLIAEKLSAYEWVEPIQQENGVYVYQFRVGERDLWVAWVEGGGAVSLSIPGVSTIRVTDAVPNLPSGDRLDGRDYPAFFDVRILSVESGTVDLILGESPVFIEPELDEP